MLFALATLALFTQIATTVAYPAAFESRSRSQCQVSNDPGFSITAVNTTLPNSNTTGVPLVFWLSGETDDYKSSYLAVCFFQSALFEIDYSHTFQ